MKNLYVESNKSYYQGFILNEQDLRRLVDLINDQLLKVSKDNSSIVTEYTLKFENGTIAKTDNIENVLEQENSGSSEIIRLGINASVQDKDDTNDKNNKIGIEFRNVDSSNEASDTPIIHKIIGVSRDWVFVTSSLIEERIIKIKRFSVNQIGEKGIGKLAFKLLSPIILLGFMLGMLFFMPSSLKKRALDKQELFEKISISWRNGEIEDPIEVILKFEEFEINRLKDNEELSQVFSPMLSLFAVIAGLLLLLFLVYYFLTRYYLVYNFCWGEYLEKFNKKESFRKTVFVVIIIGLLVSTIGGILANYSGIGK